MILLFDEELTADNVKELDVPMDFRDTKFA